MPTEAPTKRETWRDWLPDGTPEPTYLLTREEVVAAAERSARLGRLSNQQSGKSIVLGTGSISTGDLRYWESIGVLPRPLRRRHEGAQRALYPAWYTHLARQVRLYQDLGWSLDEIRPKIRKFADQMIGMYWDAARGQQEPAPDASVTDHLLAWPQLAIELEQFARWHADVTGATPTSIEVHVGDDTGDVARYTFPTNVFGDENET